MMREEAYVPAWFRVAEVLLGLSSVVVAVVVLANPSYGIGQLVVLLALSVSFSAVRMIASGRVRRRLASLEGTVLAGGGFLILASLIFAVTFPGLGLLTVVSLLAASLTIQGLGRLLHAASRGHPGWLRGSALATGAVTILVAGVAALVQGIAFATLAVLLAVVVLVNGVEGVVSGLRPTNRRQLTLLKLILFSAFYGLVLINWVDLYGTSAPAYHIWLVLTYMAPFGVLIVFQGFKDWQLALSLGLLVSLANDVGYYFVGDLLFGFHQPILPWLAGQLGFLGNQVLFTFQGGVFTVPVTSLLMGATIYARILVVSAVLYHWWNYPWRVRKV